MTKTESALVDDIIEVLTIPRYYENVGNLRPKSTYRINPADDKLIEIYLEDSAGFINHVKSAVLRILGERHGHDLVNSEFNTLKVELIVDDTMSMHEISTSNENKMVTFDCQILATDAPKAYIQEADFICPNCGTSNTVKCDYDRKIGVPRCTKQTCNREKMAIDNQTIVTNDIQTIVMQEPMTESRNNTPAILMGKLLGDNIRTAYTGQKKRITGLFHSDIDMKKNEMDTFIDILSVSDLEEVQPIIPTEEEEKKLRKDALEDGFIDKIIGSFAPNIYGYDDIKLSLLLTLAGGVKTNKRGDINTFLVGDPSMAKSELLKFAKTITQKSIFTSGRGTSAAGLTIGMVKMPDGRLVAQAGVLPLCSGGFAMIDEFDKMNKDDRSSMHEAMEQQTVSIAKAGITMTLPTETAIMAAANPKYGMYDPDMTLRDNIDIPAPLLSRFDMIWLIRDKVNMTTDMMKANHILNSFDHDMGDNVYLNDKNMVAYLNLVRTIRPKLTTEAKKKLLSIYEEMRNASASGEMPVGTRQLEALVRMSMAYAKLTFKDDVDGNDVDAIRLLIEKMYECFGTSLSKGYTQSQIQSGSKKTKQHNAVLIWQMCIDPNGHVDMEEFMKKLVDSGMTSEEAKKLFGQWERENQVKLNPDGSYTRI